MKPIDGTEIDWDNIQPPSGGCVLKLKDVGSKALGWGPAAFGRLCVETFQFPFQFG